MSAFESAVPLPLPLVAVTRQTMLWPPSASTSAYSRPVAIFAPLRSHANVNVGLPVQLPGSQEMASPGAAEVGIEGRAVLPGPSPTPSSTPVAS